MNAVAHLLQVPESLAYLLEAAGAVALERCGAILDERTAATGRASLITRRASGGRTSPVTRAAARRRRRRARDPPSNRPLYAAQTFC